MYPNSGMPVRMYILQEGSDPIWTDPLSASAEFLLYTAEIGGQFERLITTDGTQPFRTAVKDVVSVDHMGDMKPLGPRKSMTRVIVMFGGRVNGLRDVKIMLAETGAWIVVVTTYRNWGKMTVCRTSDEMLDTVLGFCGADGIVRCRNGRIADLGEDIATYMERVLDGSNRISPSVEGALTLGRMRQARCSAPLLARHSRE